eukprot:TRINITY_DN1676_c0_g1_i1.p1 TRINITY_DN1676_c0_g1~~TRINITY_DN1676_c0_g1_i1.p1  ORF type:complete len:515 (+),score=91.06 TRINITY_DN1676_c0_g1_i1:3-1547(+)
MMMLALLLVTSAVCISLVSGRCAFPYVNDGGYTFDLSALDTNIQYRPGGTWRYVLNPCGVETLENRNSNGCGSSNSVCLVSSSYTFFSAGDSSNVNITTSPLDNSMLIIKIGGGSPEYCAGGVRRSSEVALVCNPQQRTPIVTSFTSIECTYYFTLETASACPTSDPDTSTTTSMNSYTTSTSAVLSATTTAAQAAATTSAYSATTTGLNTATTSAAAAAAAAAAASSSSTTGSPHQASCAVPYTNDAGVTYDLSRLDTNIQYRPAGIWRYVINPCGVETLENRNRDGCGYLNSVCQVSTYYTFFSAGDSIDRAIVTSPIDSRTVIIKIGSGSPEYCAGGVRRMTELSLVCDPQRTIPVITSFNQIDCIYYFNISTASACPVPPSDTALTTAAAVAAEASRAALLSTSNAAATAAVHSATTSAHQSVTTSTALNYATTSAYNAITTANNAAAASATATTTGSPNQANCALPYTNDAGFTFDLSRLDTNIQYRPSGIWRYVINPPTTLSSARETP